MLVSSAAGTTGAGCASCDRGGGNGDTSEFTSRDGATSRRRQTMNALYRAAMRVTSGGT